MNRPKPLPPPLCNISGLNCTPSWNNNNWFSGGGGLVGRVGGQGGWSGLVGRVGGQGGLIGWVGRVGNEGVWSVQVDRARLGLGYAMLGNVLMGGSGIVIGSGGGSGCGSGSGSAFVVHYL